MIPYLIIAAALILLFFIITFICFALVFYSPKKKEIGENEYEYPSGDIYLPHIEEMKRWVDQVRSMPREEMCITSFDGVKLYGKYYEYSPGAPVEILFHGYRGSAERDLCGAVERCFAIGRSALIVDQRASGKSGGRLITFGIRERKDCLAWINHVISRFGSDVRIILTGISMGGATVTMAAGEDLPENVVCILSDCGYSSPKDIIIKVIKQIHMPPKLLYPIIRFGARIYGGFDLEETSSIEAVKVSKIPIIFIHGEDDDYVPCYMSQELYDACVSPKKITTIPGAGHGLSYPVDKEKYLKALRDFEAECGFLEKRADNKKG